MIHPDEPFEYLVPELITALNGSGRIVNELKKQLPKQMMNSLNKIMNEITQELVELRKNVTYQNGYYNMVIQHAIPIIEHLEILIKIIIPLDPTYHSFVGSIQGFFKLADYVVLGTMTAGQFQIMPLTTEMIMNVFDLKKNLKKLETVKDSIQGVDATYPKLVNVDNKNSLADFLEDVTNQIKDHIDDELYNFFDNIQRGGKLDDDIKLAIRKKIIPQNRRTIIILEKDIGRTRK